LLRCLCCCYWTSKQALFLSDDELTPESRLVSAMQAL